MHCVCCCCVCLPMIHTHINDCLTLCDKVVVYEVLIMAVPPVCVAVFFMAVHQAVEVLYHFTIDLTRRLRCVDVDPHIVEEVACLDRGDAFGSLGIAFESSDDGTSIGASVLLGVHHGNYLLYFVRCVPLFFVSVL